MAAASAVGVAAGPSARVSLSRVSEVPVTKRTSGGTNYKFDLDSGINNRIQALYGEIIATLPNNVPGSQPTLPNNVPGSQPTLRIFGGETGNDIWYVRGEDGAVTSSGSLDEHLTDAQREELRALKKELQLGSPPHLDALRPAANMIGYTNISLPWFQGARLGWESWKLTLRLPRDPVKRGKALKDQQGLALVKATRKSGMHEFVQVLQKKLRSHNLGDKYFAYGMYKALELAKSKQVPADRFQALKKEHGFEKDTSQDAYFHEIVCWSLSDKYARLEYMEKHGLQVSAPSRGQQVLDEVMSSSKIPYFSSFQEDRVNLMDKLGREKNLTSDDWSKIDLMYLYHVKAVDEGAQAIVDKVFSKGEDNVPPVAQPPAPDRAAAPKPKEKSGWDLFSCLWWWVKPSDMID